MKSDITVWLRPRAGRKPSYHEDPECVPLNREYEYRGHFRQLREKTKAQAIRDGHPPCRRCSKEEKHT